VNWRVIGCGGLAIAVFLAVGLLGLSFALRGQVGCPAIVGWQDREYLAEGTPAPSPAFAEPGVPGSIGSTFMGLTTRAVFGPPGSSPSTEAADRPDTIAIDCADGTFQTYRWDGITRTPAPSASPGQ
jgi:hypothetical protein